MSFLSRVTRIPCSVGVKCVVMRNNQCKLIGARLTTSQLIISQQQQINNYSTPAPATTETPISVSPPVGHDKTYAPNLVSLVDQISKLTLLEVSDLNELLKKTLNIPDTPMMMAGAMPAAAAPKEEEEAAAPVRVQTEFTLKLLKFDEGKKVALIKEVKNLLEGMNLVQAKKFVESVPTVIKAGIPKDEAEKLQTAFQAVGATCEIV